MVRAGADFSGMNKGMKKAQGTVKGFAINVSGMLKRLAVAFAGLFAIRKMVEFGKASKKAADDMAVNEAKLAVIMRKRMRATDETIDSVKDLMAAQEGIGVVDVGAQTAGAQELATYLEHASSLKTILPTMNDLIAQQYGMSASAEQATGMATMLGKVLDGQTGALSRYGFTFDVAQEKILKYGSEAQRVSLLAEIVRDSIGDMNAELGKTPQGQWKQIQYTFDAIKVSIGQGLTSVLHQLLPYIKSVANALLRAAQYASVFISSLFGSKKQVTVAGAQSDAVDDIADSYDDVGAAAKKAASSVAGFDEVNTLSSGADSGSGIGGIDIKDATLAGGIYESLGNVIGGIADKAEEFASRIKQAFKNMADDDTVKRLKDAYDGLKKSVSDLSTSIDNFFSNPNVKKVMGWLGDILTEKFLNARISDMKIITGIFEGWSGAFKTLDGLFKLDWSKMLDGIKEWGKGIGKTLEGVVDIFFPNFIEDIKKWWTDVKSTTKHEWDTFTTYVNWGSIKDVLSESWGGLKGFAKKEWESIRETVSIVWKSFTTYINWDSIKDVLSNSWLAIKTKASEEWNSMRTTVSTIWDSFLTTIKWDAVKDIVSTKWNELKTATSTKWDELKTTVSSKWDAIVAIDFNGVKDGLLKIWEDLKLRTGTIWDSMGKGIKDSINSVIDIINGFIAKVNSIKIDIPEVNIGGVKIGGGSIGIPKIPAIPKLAKGGITNGEMIATIGDNPGGREVVSPLDDLVEIVQTAVSSAMSAMGGSNRQGDINLQIDGVTFARITNAYNAKESTRIGGSMITVT